MVIQILDFSRTDDAALICPFLPSDAEVHSFAIDTGDSLPTAIGDTTHVIHTGSALCAMDDAPFMSRTLEYIKALADAGVAQMGICYGHQLLCRALAGDKAVRKSPKGLEAGWRDVHFTDDAQRVPGASGTERVWQYHYDEVVELPAGSEILATGEHSRIQAWLNTSRRIFGTQFHPEVTLDFGNTLFLRDREEIEAAGYNVDEMVKGKPSLDAGRVFFDFFAAM